MFRGYVSVLVLTLATTAGAAEQANPAHAIAQKFAAPTETAAPPPKKEAKPAAAKSEPAKMNTAAEAENGKGAAEAAKVPTQSDSKPAATTQAAKPERPPLDYEMEMLRQARAEQAAAKAAQTGTAAPATKPSATPAATTVTSTPAPKAPVQPVTAAAPAIPVSPPAAAVASTVPAVASPLPAANVEPLKAVDIAQPASPAAPVASAPVALAPVPPPAPIKTAEAAAAPEVKAAVESKPAEVKSAPDATSGPTSPATLLLAMETSSASAKSTAAASFDPVVCLNDICFVSGGLQADAIKIAKTDAIKLKTTEEASPGSCKGMIACVYRNVAVPPGAQFQLIELGSATHGTARASDLKLDATCKVSEGALICDEPIATPDFKVWVVPEETAKTAGAQAIEEAVADGLPHADVARTTDK